MSNYLDEIENATEIFGEDIVKLIENPPKEGINEWVEKILKKLDDIYNIRPIVRSELTNLYLDQYVFVNNIKHDDMYSYMLSQALITNLNVISILYNEMQRIRIKNSRSIISQRNGSQNKYNKLLDEMYDLKERKCVEIDELKTKLSDSEGKNFLLEEENLNLRKELHILKNYHKTDKSHMHNNVNLFEIDLIENRISSDITETFDDAFDIIDIFDDSFEKKNNSFI